jgi:hypothetical protein
VGSYNIPSKYCKNWDVPVNKQEDPSIQKSSFPNKEKEEELCNRRKRIHGSGSRTNYTRVYRPERNLLHMLENTQLYGYDKKSYRANRFYYYVVIPRLLSVLWHPSDRRRIRSLVAHLESSLDGYHFRGRKSIGVEKLHQVLFYRIPVSNKKLPPNMEVSAKL